MKKEYYIKLIKECKYLTSLIIISKIASDDKQVTRDDFLEIIDVKMGKINEILAEKYGDIK